MNLYPPNFSSSKEIEFVVPPTVSPFGSNRYLNSGGGGGNRLSGSNNHLTPNYSKNESSAAGGGSVGFVNKGWTLLQDVFTSSASLSAADGRKAR